MWTKKAENYTSVGNRLDFIFKTDKVDFSK